MIPGGNFSKFELKMTYLKHHEPPSLLHDRIQVALEQDSALCIIVQSPQVTSVELGEQTSTGDVCFSVLLICVLLVLSTLITLSVVVLPRGHIILLQLLDLRVEVFQSNLLLRLREKIGLKGSQESGHSIQLLVVDTPWVVDVAAN